MISPFGRYLEFKEFTASNSVMSGAMRPVVEDGKIKFFNALTRKLHGTFEEAADQARQFGITGAQGTGMRGPGPEVRLEFLKDLDKVARQQFKGKDVSVDLISLNLSGEKSFIADEIIRDQNLILAEDSSVVKALRVTVGDRILGQKEVVDLAKAANYDLGFDAKKYGKRMKTLLAEKQIHLNVTRGQHTMAIFDPLAVLKEDTPMARKLAERAGWSEGRFVEQIRNQVDEAYGSASKVEMINAIRGMEEEKIATDLARSRSLIPHKGENIYEALGRAAKSDVKELLVDVRSRSAAAKAVDGQALINSSLLNAMEEELRGQIDAGGLTGTRLKEANRIHGELKKARSSGIFNVRATGFQVKEVFGGELGEQLSELVVQAKGNFLVTQANVLDDMFGKDAAGHSFGLVIPSTNVQSGVFGSGEAVGQTIPTAVDQRGFNAILTLEPQKGKFAWFDIFTPGTGPHAITEQDIRMGAEDLREGVRAVRQAVEGNLDPTSRPYNIFKESIRSGLEGENRETIAYYEDLFDRMESGKRLPSTQLPVLIERFKESLTRKHYDTDVPRVPLPWTERAYAVSNFMEQLQSGGTAEIVEEGYMEFRGGKAVFGDADIARYFDALGGFDLDDAINVTYRKSSGEFEAILYRQPNTAEEYAKVKIQNVHRSNALKQMLRRQDPEFDRRYGLLEDIRKQVFEDHVMPEDIRGTLAHARGLGIDDDTYASLSEAMQGRDLARAADILDRQVMTQMMVDASGRLQEISGKAANRSMRGARFREVDADGNIRFPGVSRQIGGESFEFNYKQLFDVKNKIEHMDLDALARVQSQAPNASLLGEWVNAKGTLSAWLELNKDRLEELRGTDAQEVLDFLRKADFYLEETVIDALVQGRGLTHDEAKPLKDSIRNIWEEQARLTMKIDGLQMEEYLVENRMPGYMAAAKDELMEADGKLGKGLPSQAMDYINDLRATLDEDLSEARSKIFEDVEVSTASKRHARGIFDQLNQISDMDHLNETQKRYLQGTTLERRFYETFSDGKLGQEAADLFVALSKDQRYAGTVRGLGLDVAVLDFLEGKTLAADDHFERIGRFIMPTEGFSRKLSEAGLSESALNKLAGAAWEGVSASQEVASMDVGASTLYFDADRRLLPQSVIAMGDEGISELGTLMGRGTEEQLAQVSENLAPKIREMADELATVASPAKATPWMTAAKGEEMKRGGLFRQLWSDLRPGQRGGIKAAAVGVAAAMLYNAKRDKDYTEDQIGPPRDVPDQYNQGLALSGATAASIQNSFGTTYDIRTRGGSGGFGDGFLRNLATITGAEVHADRYDDPHQHTTTPSLRETIGDWIL